MGHRHHFRGRRVVSTIVDSDQVTAHDYSEDSNWAQIGYQNLQLEADPLVVPVST